MTKVYEEQCVYCDTEFMVEFEDDDDNLSYCPACGEELPTDSEEDDYLLDEEELEEDY